MKNAHTMYLPGLFLFGILLCSALVTPAISQEKHAYVPEKGFVPNEETAISIAVAVWNPIYGKKQIQSEKPFKASLKGDVWTVEGSLPESRSGEVVVGGVAVAELSRKDGRILRVSHGE